jgi:hypothetical protein
MVPPTSKEVGDCTGVATVVSVDDGGGTVTVVAEAGFIAGVSSSSFEQPAARARTARVASMITISFLILNSFFIFDFY